MHFHQECMRMLAFQHHHQKSALSSFDIFCQSNGWEIIFLCDFIWLSLTWIVREGNGNPLQYSCLEDPMDGGAWWAAVHGVAKSLTRLSDFPFTFHFHALEKEMATHSSVLAWRIPGMGEPGGLPSMVSHRVGHNWSDLTTAAAATWIVKTSFHMCKGYFNIYSCDLSVHVIWFFFCDIFPLFFNYITVLYVREIISLCTNFANIFS